MKFYLPKSKKTIAARKNNHWLMQPILLLSMAFLISVPAFAQNRTITGKVVSQITNQPLPGASVTIKGSNIGTTTDDNGNFSIQVPTGAVLNFSSVGYNAQEITVGTSDVIDINLGGLTTSVNEVVVIGYQSVRKRDLTGSVSVISAENTQRLASRSLPEQLQGLAAGVAVRSGGAPGQEAVVRIRGLSTVLGTGNPLYIIDGMFSDPNTTVNTNDVESIQILKDASAAAIYGSRAANGVIIITTKKGKEGPMKISASARYSSTMIPDTYDMCCGICGNK
jgi:TonB-dependent SusC/RagA subfamily outer membrane receptor